MLRSFLRLAGAVAFAALLVPATPAAAPGPGLAYDEIVHVLVNATPPPPGAFQSELASLAASPAPVAVTPAPRRAIGIGSIAGILNGGGAGSIAGNLAGAAVSTAMENALQAQLGATFGALAASLNSFLSPHLMRYAYWNGWERVEDVTAQSATIRKCDISQVLKLDLARKTYSSYDPSAEPTATPAAARAPRRAAPAPAGAPAAPGSAVADMSVRTTALGPKTIENQATNGYDMSATFAMTQATGSCRNGGATIRTTEYVAPLARPAVTSCPVRQRAPIPESADDVVAPPPSGGCTPTFTAHSSGPAIPAGRLSLYTLVTMSGVGSNGTTPAPAATGAGGIGFLTERGNLRTLGAGDAALFEIPAGFTKAP